MEYEPLSTPNRAPASAPSPKSGQAEDAQSATTAQAKPPIPAPRLEFDQAEGAQAGSPLPRRRLYGFVLLLLLALVSVIVGLSGTTQIAVPQLSASQLALLAGTALSAVLAVLFVREAYMRSWAWTGFVPSTRSTRRERTTNNEERSPRTLWDWLDLLIIPTVLALGGIWVTAQQHQTDTAIADNQAQDTVLDTYIDRMSTLLLNYRLSPTSDQGLKDLAYTRTLTALSRLDGRRKGVLVRFLDEAHLITISNTFAIKHKELKNFTNSETSVTLSLAAADLSNADVGPVDLSSADLRYAIMRNANLQGAILNKAQLSGADLSGADLNGANLDGATGISDRTIEQETTQLAGTTMPSGNVHP